VSVLLISGSEECHEPFPTHAAKHLHVQQQWEQQRGKKPPGGGATAAEVRSWLGGILLFHWGYFG